MIRLTKWVIVPSIACLLGSPVMGAAAVKHLYILVDARNQKEAAVYYREVVGGTDPDASVGAPKCDTGEISAIELEKLKDAQPKKATNGNNPWKKGDFRFLSRQRDQVHVWVYYKGEALPNIAIEEKDRPTQLSADLELLGRILGAQLKAEEPVMCAQATHTLEYNRATVDATVSFAPAKTKATPAEPTTIKRSIVTGPAEHLYLSVDLPVNSVNQFKYNSQTNTIELKDEPSKFYVGLNYSIGDLFHNYGGKHWYRDFSIKAFVLLDNHPIDSYGFALGYRGPIWPRGGIRFDAFSPFVGWTFSKEDELPAAQAGNNGTGRNSEFRFGVSANLDTLLKWVTKGK